MTAVRNQLEVLATGYFHQDYELHHASADAVVRAFVRGQGSEARAKLRLELAAKLESATEEDLRHLWDDVLQSSYDPAADHLSYREWFARMQDLVS